MLRRRILIYLLGFNIVVFGIALLVSSHLGQSAWDGVNVGLSHLLSISVGVATIFVALILLSISFILTKDPKVYLSLITSLIQGVFVNIYLNFLSRFSISDVLWTRYLSFSLGLFMMAIGCAIYLQANLPTNHVDRLMLSISKRFHLNLRTSKWITDVLAITLTLILCKSIQLGTFPIMIFLGPMINYFVKKIREPIQRFIYSTNTIEKGDLH